jgi:DNA-binding NarL/FixJ family response regulator
MAGPIRVGLVDDHPVVVGGIEAAFATAPDIEIVARAATLAEAARLLDRTDIDVVLLDVRLPGRQRPGAPGPDDGPAPPAVIVLSSFQARQYGRGGRFGAQAFMLKTAPTEALVGGHPASRGGRSSFTPDQLRANAFVRLTPRERELVRQVMAARSNEEIAVAFGPTARRSRPSCRASTSGWASRAGWISRSGRSGRGGWTSTPRASRRRPLRFADRRRSHRSHPAGLDLEPPSLGAEAEPRRLATPKRSKSWERTFSTVLRRSSRAAIVV